MRVIVVEDQGMLRGALSALLDMEDDIEVVGQAENGEQALELILSLEPDVVVMDIEMPLMTGLEVAERLKELKHPCRVVVLTTFSRAGYFQRAMRAGARGFLLKDSPIDEL